MIKNYQLSSNEMDKNSHTRSHDKLDLICHARSKQRLWNLTRTTNAVESFHSHFKNNFYMSHPNIHNLLNVLLQLQSEVYIKIRSIGTIKTIKWILVRQNVILNEIKKYEEEEKIQFIWIFTICRYHVIFKNKNYIFKYYIRKKLFHIIYYLTDFMDLNVLYYIFMYLLENTFFILFIFWLTLWSLYYICKMSIGILYKNYCIFD